MDFRKCAFYRLASIHKFAELLKCDLHHLDALANTLHPNYRIFSAKKGSGRMIEAPSEPLKKIQRRIHRLLGNVDPPPYLFSAYKGRSAVNNAAAHIGQLPMIKLDIRKFYPSSNGRRVFKFFESDLECSLDIARLAFKLCTIPDRFKNGRTHLPTGGCTSSILAFLIYREMFDALNSKASELGVKFSVFADDITFSGLNADFELVKSVDEIVTQYGLVLNKNKVKVWAASHTSKSVTGALVTPKGLKVPWKQKIKISEMQESLASESVPKSRCVLYQKLVGAFTAAGQVESRYNPAAAVIKNQWKSDPQAWSIHKTNSGKRGSNRESSQIK